MAQKSDKTFGVTEPIDMLAKLEWEWDKMRSFPITEHSHEKSYYAINAATTSWHLSEWLGATMDETNFKRISAEAGTPIQDWVSLRAWATQECYALRICDQLANGAKHMVIKPREDAISTTEREFLMGNDLLTHYLMIEDNGNIISIDWVVGLTLSFWRDVFVSAGIATAEQVSYPMVERTWNARK